MRRALALAALAALGAALWWRKHPSACPYSQRLWIEAPHPLITRARLREVLGPVAGKRVLEIGPGTGYYTVDLANWVRDGEVAVLDLQPEMLKHTMGLVGRAGFANVIAAEGDARSLPYGDGEFDAVILITTLGEIPDREAAIAEISRVLAPGGVLITGELALGDPHFTTPGQLARLAAGSDLDLEERKGPWIGYFARLRKPG